MLGGIRYQGGKHPHRGVGQWIASLIPVEARLYVEPFAGMLGVLLSRKKSGWEVANDLNERIVNWWEVMRTQTDELHHRLAYTPWHESVFDRCRETLDEGDALERAFKFSVVTTFSSQHTDEGNSFMIGTSTKGREYKRNPLAGVIRRLQDTAKRVSMVAFTCRPASRLLEQMSTHEGAVIYCDPPYYTSHRTYRWSDVDVEELRELLLAQTGRVAISGYRDEWDSLDWMRHEKDVWASGVSAAGRIQRTEVLWTNYDPEEYKSQEMQYELV